MAERSINGPGVSTDRTVKFGAREESGNQTFTELSFCTVDDDPNV